MSGNLLVYSLFGLGFGIFIFIKGFKWQSLRRMITDIPTSKVRSIAMGPVEVYGKVVPVRTQIFKSPFTDRDCVWLKWSVEEYRSNGKSGHWAKIDGDLQSDYFYVQDETGKVMVNPVKAEVEIERDSEMGNGLMHSTISRKGLHYLESRRIKTKGFFKHSMRLREWFIEPDDNIYVMGKAEKNPFSKKVLKNEDGILIEKGDFKHFYISDKSEKELLEKYTWKIIGGLWGGSSLIVLCSALILFMLSHGIF